MKPINTFALTLLFSCLGPLYGEDANPYEELVQTRLNEAITATTRTFVWPDRQLKEVRQNHGYHLEFMDMWAPVVIQMGRAGDYPSFEAFQKAVTVNPIAYKDGILTYTSEADETFEYPANSKQLPKINGKPVNLNPENTCDSPFLRMEHGGEKAVVKFPGYQDVVLDFGQKNGQIAGALGSAVDVQNADHAADRSKPAKNLPLPGETLVVEGREAFLILPENRDASKPTPWVWYAPTLRNLPGKEETWMFERILAAGIAIAGIDVGESMGNPGGRAHFSAFHRELVENRGMAPRPCLLARSRGGLMLYNWAAENPKSVAAIAGIYPVGDLASWPGLKRASTAYGLTPEELNTRLPHHNPTERLAPLAKAGVPLMHIHGDNDRTVPLDKNSGEIKRRYDQLGGQMTLETIKGGGHDMNLHWFQSQTLVDFIIRHKDR